MSEQGSESTEPTRKARLECAKLIELAQKYREQIGNLRWNDQRVADFVLSPEVREIIGGAGHEINH